MSSKKKAESKPKLIVRNAVLEDIEQIKEISIKSYPNMQPYTTVMLRSHQNNYPEGQFVAEYENKIVGYCVTFRISGDIALGKHTWSEISGGGYASRHEPDGDYLYGMDVCVDPDYRGLRIGQRLYRARMDLCKHLRLKGIVFGGRIPGYAKRAKKFKSPQDYIDQVVAKKVRDQVLNFQLKNGFEPIGILPGYLREDKGSDGFATHMVWNNPQIDAEEVDTATTTGIRSSNKIRVAAVQYQLRRIKSFDEFASNVEYFVDIVSDYKCDFVVFPELFTLQLLSLESRTLTPAESIATLTDHTDRFKTFMSELAVRFNINIIGGSHPTMKESEDIQNISYVFLRDGSVHMQPKLHPTPNERYWWNIKGGKKLSAIPTDCGPIGVLICYDCEFPELARHLINQGVKIIFVPFCTDERKSYLRVRYCAQARAVENQCYVVMAGNVGNLINVENLDIQYAQSCILTPCDFQFSRDGVAADTTPNAEMVALSDLDLEALTEARNAGTVLNLKDRRFDLYSISWNGDE